MTIRRIIVALVGCLTVAATAAPTQAATSRHHGHPELIAFSAGVDGHDQIFTIGTDGHGRRQITVGPSNYRNPDWSRDGRWLTFEADDGVSTSWIVVARPDGGHARTLTTPTGTQVGQPAFSADGRRILFERYDGKAEDAVYSMNLDGGDLQRVTSPPVGHGDTDPNVSPDGRTLSFVRFGDSADDGPTALFTQDLRSHVVRQLTPYAAHVATNQDWSPDGRRLAYTHNGWDRPAGANANIIEIDRHGKHQRQLTHYTDGVTQTYLGSYAPDGEHLVTRLEDGKSMSLVIIRRDGTHPVTIMSDPDVEPHFITWGPATN